MKDGNSVPVYMMIFVLGAHYESVLVLFDLRKHMGCS